MKIYVIQPNLTTVSETWLYRMNLMLGKRICGFAVFATEESYFNGIKVFNLNGRYPNLRERILIRLKILKYNVDKTMRQELYNNIKKSGTEVLLIHYANTANYLWNVVNKLSIPIYIHVHGHDIIWDCKYENGQSVHDSNYKADILRIGQKTNITFIANSEGSFHNLVTIGVKPEKIIKKVFGVDLPLINRDYFKKEMTVLYLGRFVDFKGPDIVLNAFINACDLGFKGQLIMAGDGSLKEICETIAQKSLYSDRIHFTGAVNTAKAANLFLEADIYSMHNCKGLVTNGYEMFGVTLIEALSYGLPIITSTIGGPSEIIDHEVDGLLVSPKNVEAHAQAFMRLFNDRLLCSTLGNNARNKIKNKYSSEIEKEALFNILQIKDN